MAKRRCSKCGETKETPDDFYIDRGNHSGFHGWCKDCSHAAGRAKTAMTRLQKGDAINYSVQYRENRAERIEARRLARWAVQDGLVDQAPCEVCGSEDSLIFHEDFDLPLEVRWLCKRHVYSERVRLEGEAKSTS